LVDIEFVDILAATVLTIAVLRGLLHGLIREAFSVIGIAAAYIAIRTCVTPASDWLAELTGDLIPAGLSPWIVGSVIFVFTIAIVGKVGRAIRSTLRLAGMGLMDRLGGGLLGAAEGGLVIALVFNLAASAVGRDHPNLADTYTLQALEKIEQIIQDNPDVGLDVSSPPLSLGRFL
jgi:uncharacterized membrane protein required for colicin V production